MRLVFRASRGACRMRGATSHRPGPEAVGLARSSMPLSRDSSFRGQAGPAPSRRLGSTEDVYENYCPTALWHAGEIIPRAAPRAPQRPCGNSGAVIAGSDPCCLRLGVDGPASVAGRQIGCRPACAHRGHGSRSRVALVAPPRRSSSLVGQPAGRRRFVVDANRVRRCARWRHSIDVSQ